MNINLDYVDEKDFKEDSVRREIIDPLLKELDFEFDLKGNKTLSFKTSLSIKSPTILGSNTKIGQDRILIPDYILYVENKPICVLDAKAPTENIKNGNHPQQAFYYAINAEIKAPYYALCNGKEFTLFTSIGQELILEIDLKNELETKFDTLKSYITNNTESQIQKIKEDANRDDEWYLNRSLPKAIKPQKQKAKRHFGCLAYFTRQSWDIVQNHILNFTQEGDVVLDSFGGSGVSAIEAMMKGRVGIHIDLNPLSVFMATALSTEVNLSELYEIGEMVLKNFEKITPKNDKEAKEMLKNASYYPSNIQAKNSMGGGHKKTLWIPKDEILPKGSDVATLRDIFTPSQIIELALLRGEILKTKGENIKLSLLLALVNTITMCNKTFHETEKRKGSGGVCGIFNYYRYRIAKTEISTPFNISETFRRKLQRIISGKRELQNSPHFYQMLPKSKFIQGDATNLKEIESNSVDYIYTDPPYGAKIPYLDLSTMWNAWLDFPVDKTLLEKECIEKGSLNKSTQEYYDLIKQGLKEMYRVLKFNRWMSFVFQHQSPQLWQTIVEYAEEIGFEYIGSIRQSNGQSSFKKVQNPFTVLSGQLIMHFKKVENPKTLAKESLGDDYDLIFNHIEALIAKENGATLEEIYGELTITGLEMGFLHELGNKFETLTPIINENYDYDKETQKYHIKKGSKFKSHNISIETRAKYFIVSFLKKAQRQNTKITFDDICLEVIPLLKNGVTPSKELIKDILEEVSILTQEGNYVFKSASMSLFN
ncbi:DNA methyltransferase [Helicobacter cappadocius]|uniref:DNA methyltransferase n=1 Tax=Helicobacter cappadocius TaxID=3063998 RepID=A0AA90TB13_9HELI|nr:MULTISPECIES: DNA methyltransferase [unclassified Helicobacter]MDO7252519.1 DNA methyltransferase [Helicobacter sp. faydin-H75]MDP2538386.1 DNA methyltransferase [Helicobacter sp. faydin-H76]